MDSENEKQLEKTYPLEIDFIPEEYRQKSEKELNENPETSKRSLQDLKAILKNDKSTDDIDFHEDFLTQFLRQSKYDVQKAFKRLQAFMKFRRSNAKYFGNVDPERLANISDYRYCTPLPSRCEDGCTLTLFELGLWDPANISVEDLMQLGVMMYHQSLRNPIAQINGFKMIVDWKGSGLRQLRYMTPTMLYSSYQAFMGCTPARLKAIHMVNESFAMKIVWTIFRPFLSTKLRSRYVFHSSPEGLLDYFPKYALPPQYGGDMENYYMKDWMKEANEQQKLATLGGQCNHF